MTPMEAPATPTSQREGRIIRFQWSLAELREDLVNWLDNYAVKVTLKEEEPGTSWMKF